jgi:hypothetical protein
VMILRMQEERLPEGALLLQAERSIGETGR